MNQRLQKISPGTESRSADTFAVFEDPNSVTLEDFRKGEQRYVTIGMDAFGRILVVVCTWRDENIRYAFTGHCTCFVAEHLKYKKVRLCARRLASAEPCECIQAIG